MKWLAYAAEPANSALAKWTLFLSDVYVVSAEKVRNAALIYDHFSPRVLMQLEDYGFCEKGEGADYVLAGKVRYDAATGGGVNGGIPVNTHGGNLNEAYIIGMTHVVEAVEQVRGTAVNQVKDCEFALASGGPAALPVSSLILRSA